jgi:hypothetical protein
LWKKKLLSTKMTTAFTNVGEFRRGKGNKKTRLGPRVNIGIIGEKRGGANQSQKPDDIAGNRLFRLLMPSLGKKEASDYVNLMKNGEQIRFLNMPVLAEVLLYMHNISNNVTKANFNYNRILPYIEKLLPHNEITPTGGRGKEYSDEELQIMRLRMAATFLRYVRYVIVLMKEATEQLKAAQEKGQSFANIIDEY